MVERRSTPVMEVISASTSGALVVGFISLGSSYPVDSGHDCAQWLGPPRLSCRGILFCVLRSRRFHMGRYRGLVCGGVFLVAY
jgi:hypothetical protein